MQRTTSKEKLEVLGESRALFGPDGRRLLYDNGLPFTAGVKRNKETGLIVHKDKLAFNLDKQKERVFEEGFASLILVDGGVGKGKTTMDVIIADYLTGRPIKFEEQLRMGGDDFIKGLRVCYDKGHVVACYDESGDFNKRGTLSKLNATLNRIFEIYRAFKIIVVLSLPTMLKLDEGIFESNLPRMLIHIEKRDKKQGTFAVYDLPRMMWIRARAKDKRVVIKNKAYQMVQPNFRGHFLNLPDERAKELSVYSTKGKLDLVDIVSIKGEGLMTYQELAHKVDRNHIWVRQKISKLGIKPSKKYKGKNYFAPEVVGRLERAKA